MLTMQCRALPAWPLRACALAAFVSTSAAAAELPTADAVTVTASRASTKLQEMPLHTTVLTQDDIQQSPAGTLDQLLRDVPGLLVSGAPAYTTDPTGHNIKLRGMDKKVLVLVDGIPVLDPFFTTIQWFKVPLSAIERVEIVRGGGSSLWGNLAVGGVINIVSKRPDRQDGHSGQATLSAGSFNTWSAALSQNVVVSDALSYNLSADVFTTDGYNNTPPALRAAYWPGREASSATSHNLRLSTFFKPQADLKGFVRVGYHEQSEQIGGYTYGRNLQQSPDMQASVTQSFGQASRVVAQVYAQRVSFDKYNGAGCYAASTYACGASVSGSGASAAQQASPTLQYASSHDVIAYREHGASVVYAHNRAGWLADWQAGLDYRGISGEDAQQSFRTPTAALPAALRVQRANDGAGAQTFTGVFSQIKLRPLDPLDITFAARVDHYRSSDGQATQTSYSNVASPVAASPTGGAVPGVSKTAFDPSLSLRYELSEALVARGAVYKAFRAPGLNNMYRSFGSSAITIANPLLRPETLFGQELGLDWKAPGLALGITVFQADVKDVVATYGITAGGTIPEAVQAICGSGYTGVANAACPGTVSLYTNGQDQRAKGLELDGQWALSPRLSLNAYGTFTRSYYTRSTTGDPVRKQLPLIPKYVAGASLSWQATDRWSHFINLRYNSAMLLSSLTSTPALTQGDYTVLNLSSRWRWSAQTALSVSVANLSDKRYSDGSANNAQSVSYALPRSVTLAMHTRF